MAIRNVGKVFNNPQDFQKYLEGIRFGSWRPRFVTVHHTAEPSLATWRGWQERSRPVTDSQWLRNLAQFYGSKGWSAGPHFFVTPTHICVLSPPDQRGVHAVSFNSNSWGVEIVGDFDRESFSGDIHDMAVGALAAMHSALGITPAPYQRGVRGLHFHRDDPRTSKTCPGKKIDKKLLTEEISEAMAGSAGGDDPEETRVSFMSERAENPKALRESTIAQSATIGGVASAVAVAKEATDAARDTVDNVSGMTSIVTSPWVWLAIVAAVACAAVIWFRYRKLRDQGV